MSVSEKRLKIERAHSCLHIDQRQSSLDTYENQQDLYDWKPTQYNEFGA